MQKLRASVSGKWVTKKPIIQRGNKYVSIGSNVTTNRTHEKVMYSINIPKGSKLKGVATATLFGTKNVHKPITVKISYQMIDIGEFHIKELESKCIGTWCTNEGWTLTTYMNKETMTASSNDLRYKMTLVRK